MDKIRIALLLFLGCCIYKPVIAQTGYQLAGESSITIHGASTLHDWKATVPEYEGTFQMTDIFSKKKIKEGPAVQSAVLKFAVESIDGGRGPSMNKKIKTALKSTEYPHIIFELSEPAPIKTANKEEGQFTLQAKGKLKIAGATQEVTLALEGQRQENGNLHFTVEKPLKMSDYKIEPPSAMFGQIVTKDDIKVAFDLVLSPKN